VGADGVLAVKASSRASLRLQPCSLARGTQAVIKKLLVRKRSCFRFIPPVFLSKLGQSWLCCISASAQEGWWDNAVFWLSWPAVIKHGNLD